MLTIHRGQQHSQMRGGCVSRVGINLSSSADSDGSGGNTFTSAWLQTNPAFATRRVQGKRGSGSTGRGLRIDSRANEKAVEYAGR